MGNLISGKDALKLFIDGVEVQYKCDKDPSIQDRWTTITNHYLTQYNLGVFLDENTTWKFRLKPKTINLNGVDVGTIQTSQWERDRPNKVVLEFNSREEAVYFQSKAMKIFNNIG